MDLKHRQNEANRFRKNNKKKAKQDECQLKHLRRQTQVASSETFYYVKIQIMKIGCV